ncbi:hypothetical protein Cgig2_002167 [Carnegiea gigantea]|uniref:Uncharacterized protein n=1 Tax=Carnegiea gigantea TaxID=171969 RepID=A0A9Q1KXP8_9CARY|nr:hypothetical protein Cgig2_002167 [Carnegiea gigantea]
MRKLYYERILLHLYSKYWHLERAYDVLHLISELQVVSDDGAVSWTLFWVLYLEYFVALLLPCAINAACAALVDAGIPMKHLAVAICCCVAEPGCVILDPTRQEEQILKGVYMVAENEGIRISVLSVLPQGSKCENGEPIENGIITSVTHGAMSVEDYFHCLERGRAASAKLSNFLRKSLQTRLPTDLLGET